MKFKLIFIVFFSICINLFSQEDEAQFPTIKWSVRAQFWARYSDLNEGSLVNGEPTKHLADISIRRIRIPISSQITPRLYAAALFGGNNLNLKTNTFPIGVLDLYAEYAFAKSFEIGVGKSAWQGLNRWNVRSSQSMMGLDSPLFTLNTVEKTDDLGRNLGVWFKGQAHRFDYRLSLMQPITVKTAPNNKTDFANNKPKIKISSYIKYQFFGHESNKTAYQTGTYMQHKKVFNIGTGFQYQEKAMSDGDAKLPQTTFYDLKHWAIDSYLNLPLANKNAITTYLGFYYYGFGKDYIRNVGANNPTNAGGTDFNGPGVAFPMIGTGSSLYMQLGYAFTKVNLFKQPITIQPNIAIQHSYWDALNDAMTVYDFNVNFMFNDHQNKLSLAYQYRPIFDHISLQQKDYKGMAVLQYQISFW